MPTVSAPKESRSEGFPVVGIGASAGGLEAFEAFFKAMPPRSGMAFVLVAHLDPNHVSLLPQLLAKHTEMPVRHAVDGTAVEPDHVYVIPPKHDLSILRGVLQLLDPVRPRGANLPIDTFFRGLARDQGSRAVGIILSGTGSDGTLGIEAIKGEVGMVMVQDEASAAYDGMPRSAAATGLADYVLPPAKMPEQLIRYMQHANRGLLPAVSLPLAESPGTLEKIFVLLRDHTGHDFSLYKKNTLYRRIERRMSVHQIDDVAEYVRYLRTSVREIGILFKELLIGVTQFFRDPEAFEALAGTLLETLREKSKASTIRVWVPGCSSGEEAYSLAILLTETMAKLERRWNVQIFGTDIDKDAIAIARAGSYPASIAADVDPERLRRFFSQEEDGTQKIHKSIREMLVFAPQNVVKDPPFTKLDLLSCRNLLIYLGPELQKRLLPTFHYSLSPNGLLFLGSSETISQATDLFTPVDRKQKIFRCRPGRAAAHMLLELPASGSPRPALDFPISETIRKAEEVSTFQLVEAVLHQSDLPPAAIIDDAANIVYIHGRTGHFLEPAEGRVSVNILEMARPGLKAELAAAVRKVGQTKEEVVFKGIDVSQNGGSFRFDLIVRPLLEQGALRGLMMVLFQEVPTPVAKARTRDQPGRGKGRKKTVAELERELLFTKETLQATIEELETSNEELKSANEELQSTNEELQSTNEEMETSKEELQSLNEEATTVNAELQSRIEELSKANDDLRNLLDSTNIATLFLDGELAIRRFTPAATEIVPLTASDAGRPVRHFASRLAGINLAEEAERVLGDLAVRTREVETSDGRHLQMRIRPYRTLANVIDGVVITFDDITELKRVEQSLREAQRHLREKEVTDEKDRV